MQDEHSTHQVECLLQWHKAVRAIAIATSIISARHLFHDGFHYPPLLLLAHTIIALLLQLCVAKNDALILQRRQGGSLTQWTWQVVFSALIAAGLVLAYQAMLHTRNTTLCLMALGLTWIVTDRAVTLVVRPNQNIVAEELLRLTTIVACIGLLFWNERMLDEKGIQVCHVRLVMMHCTDPAKLILYAAACGPLAKFLHDNNYVEDQLHFGFIRFSAHASGLITSVFLAATILGISGWRKRRDFHLHGRLLWVLVSLIAGAVSITSTAVLQWITSDHSMALRLPFDFDLGSPSLALLLVTALEIDNQVAQHRPTITSTEQWLAFAVACASTVDWATVLFMDGLSISRALRPALHYEAVEQDENPY
ncbi:uncharacterized protein MYCFIDRAFT_213916 [Pseudocercospora fijiensis CIRAD86]|uniref:Uncharacterized protein n=1 Tax=Pseudocercospora fijiensis (strain CIRAD86) TaxID=383855 RepID=M2Z725_PSEFD|nr:uncharacterized protein MYCFIDRAFT_213916 [Pseudocercospora fijiensis CIRAD86]EME85590.1 hypothetical protein MYCFIDRAFT_213916 [Pseudocercospora fijiensis CIRAD86]